MKKRDRLNKKRVARARKIMRKYLGHFDDTYLIPGKVPELIIGYRGMVELARRAEIMGKNDFKATISPRLFQSKRKMPRRSSLGTFQS